MARPRRPHASASLRLWSRVSEAMNSKRSAAARSRVYIIVTTIAALLGTVSATGLISQYTAAEARKHIGENATVVGTIDCIGHGRRHVDLQIGGCDLSKAQLWIVLPNDATGPELDPETVRGVTVAVTGKIESSSGTPQITIKSTTDIQARSALQTNYIGQAYDKETKGDIDGAIADLNQAIEHQPARRDEACEHLARVKEKRGDWTGALAAYDRLIALDPNKSGSYYVRATAKKQHGDFEAAMADFTRAAELRSDSGGFTNIGNMRKEHGDAAGASAEYDKAIELCNRQIAGIAKSDPQSVLGSDPYLSRGYAKELKGDLDGALADYTQAIANSPARAAMAYDARAAMAYDARGNIRRARGDLSGAIADYQHKYQITHYPDDKQKLEQVRAEAKPGAKKVVVTQPSIQVAQNEQSSNKNKGEVSPESIAEAFVQAYSGADIDALAGLYADRVDHTNSGVISNAAVRAQAKEYFARWPVRQWSLAGPVKATSTGPSRQKVIFSASYDASNPQTNKHASGIAKETLIVASDASGTVKIVSQKEQTSKRSSGQSGESGKKTSEDANFEAAKAEYDTSSHDEAARVRYVTKLADIYYQFLQNEWANGRKRELEGGDLVFEELTKYPAPADSDSKKLSHLLIGEWAAPRHGNPYDFRADGKWGRAGSSLDDHWRIKGNQFFARDATGKIDEGGTIILLNNDYFIYADGNGYATFYARFQKALADAKRIQKQAEAASQQTPPGTAVSRIVSTEVVDIPSAHADAGIKAGDIKITFGDSRTEVVTKNGNCMQPHVSVKGDVGWIRCTGFDRKGYALNDKIVVISSDGGEREFKPLATAPFIGEWNFAADGSAIVIQSMSFHGPSSYARYDLATGKMTNKKDGRNDSEPAPDWAQPLSD
jgi:tetratricopeptide (TPR) repeat protein